MPADPAPAAPSAAEPRVLPYHAWLHGLAILLVLGTFLLIAVGGNVTSLDAGMAVPDWPGTFGYNMFLAPWEKWGPHAGGAFWEHSHRLIGAGVGLVTIAVAVGAWLTQRTRPWLRWLTLGLLGLVVVQGLMGGFRVTENSVFLAGVHGVVGQLILAGTILVAASLGWRWLDYAPGGDAAAEATPAPWWRWEVAGLIACLFAGLLASILLGGRDHTDDLRVWSWLEVGGIWIACMVTYGVIVAVRLVPGLRRAWPRGIRWNRPQVLTLLLWVAILAQLVLGASVRHSGADKVIPDAPLVYGRVVPPVTAAGLEQAVEAYPGEPLLPPELVSLGAVWLQYAHRVLAFVVLGLAVWAVASIVRRRQDLHLVFPPMMLTLAITVFQVLLGLATVWSGVYPTMATYHQATGALLLGLVTWLAIRTHLASGPTPEAVGAMSGYNPAPPHTGAAPLQGPTA